MPNAEDFSLVEKKRIVGLIELDAKKLTGVKTGNIMHSQTVAKMVSNCYQSEVPYCNRSNRTIPDLFLTIFYFSYQTTAPSIIHAKMGALVSGQISISFLAHAQDIAMAQSVKIANPVGSKIRVRLQKRTKLY